MQDAIGKIGADLLSLADLKYKDFHSRLMPSVEKERIIGIRTPVLRAYAKRLDGEAAKAFLSSLPHYYYEENNLHAFLIEGERDAARCFELLREFLPYVDNWATCDMMNPRVIAAHLGKLKDFVLELIASNQPYLMRFGIVTVMRYFSGQSFSRECFNAVVGVKSEHYYVRMAVAWCIATLLCTNADEVMPVLEGGSLDKWTHNKTISKAIESHRITKEQKNYLRKLKLKGQNGPKE